MAKPLSHTESEKPLDPSEMDKKEILKASASRKRLHKTTLDHGKSVKNPVKQWKDYSTLHDLKHQSKLDLSNRGLRNLSEVGLSNLYQGVELNLSNNPLSPLAFRQWLSPDLKKLDLSGCGLKQLPNNFATHCNKLEILNLSNNPFGPTIDCLRAVAHLRQLKKLDLSGCGFQQFPYDFPMAFNELEELNLSNNPLLSGFTSDDKNWHLRDLKKLDLSGCGLTELPCALQRYINLQELNLSNNFIGHLDLLEKLKNKSKFSVPSWRESDTKPLEPISVLSIMWLPKLIKLVFEDAVYTQSERVWTVKWHNGMNAIDVSSTSSAESYMKLSTAFFTTKIPSVESQTKKTLGPSTSDKVFSLAMLSDDPFEENDSDEKIYREFCQVKRIKKKLTIENYHFMLFSLKIAVCVVVAKDPPVEYILQQKTTCGRSLKTINAELLTIEPTLRRPPLKMPSLVLESITHLKNGVILLFKWLMGQTYVEESDQRESIRRAFETAFEKASGAFFSRSLSTADRLLASKLRIVSKILESFSKPEAAALQCLQLLQELHDLREIQVMFSFRGIKGKMLGHDDISSAAVHEINKILFEFVRVFLKPSPTAEEWPATVQLGGKTYNPLNDERFLETRLFNVSFPQELKILQRIISRQGSQDRCEIDTKYNAPVIASCEQSIAKSISVDEEGGCFSVPVASAFLVFPPDAVEGEITLTCSRVRYKDCEEKPRDGEAFASRILKIEPEGMFFREPVTVLLSHSAYEDDEDFLDFYELIVENLNAIDRQELNTESISCMEDLPKEIRNQEMLGDYLPFAKVTIYETCTLVAATRIRADQILVPTNRTRIFHKKYGENKEVKITFPPGVTKKILCLTVRLFPADDVLSSDLYLDDKLVCVPVIKVSGQPDPFLKPVHVELTYSHNDVANIEEDFLPVGKKIRFTTEYGLLLRNQRETESKSKWLKLNERNEVYIERQKKDKIKLSFSVKHFCKLPPVVKKSADAQLKVDDSSSSSVSQSRYAATVLAVHDTGSIPKRIYAVLAPVTAKQDIKEKWKVNGTRFGHRLKCEEPIYFCVPLTDSHNNYHLPLKDYTLWFDPDMEFELANNLTDSVDLRGRFMHFLNNRSCNGDNHSTQGDCRAKAPIHTYDTKSFQATTGGLDKLSFDESQRAPKNSFGEREVSKNNIQRTQVLADVIHRCEVFEKMVETAAQEELKIKRAFVTDAKGGKATKIVNVAGPLTTIIFGLSCGISIAMGLPTFGIGSFVGAAVAGVALAVTNFDKHLKQSHAEVIEEIEKGNMASYLNCIVKEVAKELSHIFEYQLFQLKDEREIENLANCAVDLMLDLKKGDEFDRNTLLKKVLQDGKMKKRELMTRSEDKWYAPDVFRKPGLRRMVNVGKDRAELKYFVRPENACDIQTYGYRSQFLEIKKYGAQSEEDAMEVDTETPMLEELCEKCSDYRKSCSNGTYFVESSIDLEYTKQCSEALFYRPLHVLVRCPAVLASFINNHEAQPSLAGFLNGVIGFHDDNVLHPVYRPHSPGKVPHLSKADLSGADFSRSDFTNVCLEECDFTKCVMLFAELQGAKMSGSKFVDTLISHSNMVNMQGDGCQWTKTSVLHSRVDNARLTSVEPSVGGNRWDNTNLWKAITGKKRPMDCNGRLYVMEDMPNQKQSRSVPTYC